MDRDILVDPQYSPPDGFTHENKTAKSPHNQEFPQCSTDNNSFNSAQKSPDTADL